MVTHFEFYPFWILPILNSTQLWSPPSGGRTSFGKDFNAGRTSFGKDFNVLSQVFFITWGAVTAHKPTFRVFLSLFLAMLAFFGWFWRHFMENRWFTCGWSSPNMKFSPNWNQYQMMSTQRWEFFTVGQFQFGKISKWMNLNLVGNQFGSFTMGVNLKKVNINLEFVSERSTRHLQQMYIVALVLKKFQFQIILQIWNIVIIGQ